MQPRHGSSECSASGSKGCSSSAGGSGGGGRLVVRIADLVGSPVMAELQELLLLGPGAEQERDMFSNWFSLQVRQQRVACAGPSTSRCSSLPCCAAGSNSPPLPLRLPPGCSHVPAQSAQRVLATFTSWDHDASGSLSRQEFSAISQVGMRAGAQGVGWIACLHVV